MRILYDHQVFSLQNAGGAARYHYELIRHLQKAFDVNIHVALGLYATIYPFPNLGRADTAIYGRRTSLHPGVVRYIANEILGSGIAVMKGRFDIYHPTLYRAMKAVRCRAMVATHHDCAHEKYPELFRNSSVVIRNKRRLYSDADAIICVSESSRSDLLRYYDIAPEKAICVPHGFSPLKASTSEEQPLPWRSGRPYLLFVGFRGTYKNFDSLLKAYAQAGLAADYDLVAVGGGEFSVDELENARRLGVEERLRNIQNANDDLLSTIYRHASVFVYPSLYEGFGFPPLEAMNYGCPVLVSRTSSMPEVCGDAAFYFDPHDPEDLTEALVDVLNSVEKALKRAKGYERIKYFNWNNTAAATYNVYSKLAAAN